MGLQARFRHNRDFNVSFTGGEPTTNPDFIKFAEYLNTKRIEYKEQFNLHLDLTTNGAMSKKIANSVIENFDHVTVSYHCEAHDTLKKQVLDRILQFNASSKIQLKVNVMLHAEYFEECKELITILTDNNINFIPRVIGDEPGSVSAKSQQYTEEQKSWFNSYWGVKSEINVGRMCCGGRKLKTFKTVGETEVIKFLPNRRFESWACSVNWFFLHIEQQSDSVFHHQTCQATFDGRGSIGKLSEGDSIIENLEHLLSTNSMPIIRCPNTFCGCGLCTPKASTVEQLLTILPNSLKTIEIFKEATTSRL